MFYHTVIAIYVISFSAALHCMGGSYDVSYSGTLSIVIYCIAVCHI